MRSSASPAHTERPGGLPSASARRSASTGSFSMAVTTRPRRSISSVSTPSPGPISNTRVPAGRAAASTIASRALRSTRKFCPSTLFGWKPCSMHHALTWLGLVRFITCLRGSNHLFYLQQFHNKSHSDEFAIINLSEIASSWVFINSNRNFIHSWKRMHNR